MPLVEIASNRLLLSLSPSLALSLARTRMLPAPRPHPPLAPASTPHFKKTTEAEDGGYGSDIT